MSEKFYRWDAADDLRSKEDMALYLEACIKEDPGDGSLIRRGLGDIARSKGMSELARATGLAREGLYRALSADGNPEFGTILKVIRALGFELHTTPTKPTKPRKASAKAHKAPRKRAARELAAA